MLVICQNSDLVSIQPAFDGFVFNDVFKLCHHRKRKDKNANAKCTNSLLSLEDMLDGLHQIFAGNNGGEKKAELIS